MAHGRIVFPASPIRFSCSTPPAPQRLGATAKPAPSRGRPSWQQFYPPQHSVTLGRSGAVSPGGASFADRFFDSTGGYPSPRPAACGNSLRAASGSRFHPAIKGARLLLTAAFVGVQLHLLTPPASASRAVLLAQQSPVVSRLPNSSRSGGFPEQMTCNEIEKTSLLGIMVFILRTPQTNWQGILIKGLGISILYFTIQAYCSLTSSASHMNQDEVFEISHPLRLSAWRAT